jgi:hypothetical protein
VAPAAPIMKRGTAYSHCCSRKIRERSPRHMRHKGRRQGGYRRRPFAVMKGARYPAGARPLDREDTGHGRGCVRSIGAAARRAAGRGNEHRHSEQITCWVVEA